jgi:CAAX protease family protein
MLNKPVLAFCALVFAISWSIFFVSFLLGAFDNQLTAFLVTFAFMWGPAIAGLVCAQKFDKGEVIKTLGLTPRFNRWLFIAWLVPLIICTGAVAFSLLGPNVQYIPLVEGLKNALGDKATQYPMADNMDVVIVISAISLGAGVNAILLISEELGWRGFLWDKIITHGFWKASLFTGIVWGLWHAPLIVMGHNYPGYPIIGIFAMVVFTTLISPIIGLMRLKNGSVWAASLFHGTINAVASLTVYSLATPNLLWRGITGLGGMLALLVGCIWVYFVLKENTTKAMNQ